MPDRDLTLLTIFLATAAWSSANAADPAASSVRDCNKIGDYKEMVTCFAANASEADAELARTYDKVLSKLPGPLRRDLLVSSQAAWLAYRAAYCSLVSSAVEGGSLQPVIRNACHADLTRIRIKELELQLNCREGDPGCVAPSRQP